MAKLVILGSAHAVPDENHENTHMALLGKKRQVLIDCVGSPIVRLKLAGIEISAITDLILTHFHPDHVSGVPSLLMGMWLLGRRNPLHVYGLHYTLDRIENMMSFYQWSQWPDFFPVIFHRLPIGKMTLALDCPDFKIFTSPVQHLIPTIGLRIEISDGGGILAYSCDTEPCQAVEELAAQADILIHEATGANIGHTHPAQAGKIAAQAQAAALYLIHYNPQDPTLISEAKKEFAGPVALAEDFMELEI
jgi:ribonuclease Z